MREVLVPCTGRLQPEHVLKAFESGADLVCTVACEEDNCHYLEGSQRCTRRVDYIRGILDEVGLGAERLLLFHLPGTAAEDTALGAAGVVPACSSEVGDARVAAIRAGVLQALDGLGPNPLHAALAEVTDDPYLQLDISDDDNED